MAKKRESKPAPRFTYGDFATLANRFTNESDRSAAILAGAYLDERLNEFLQGYLVADERVRDLFIGYSPLATFSARITIAYSLGFLSEMLFQDLSQIREIRNYCAHHEHDLSFDKSPIRDRCSNLSIARMYALRADEMKAAGQEVLGLSTRMTYLLSVSQASAHFALLHEQTERRTVPDTPSLLEPSVSILDNPKINAMRKSMNG